MLRLDPQLRSRIEALGLAFSVEFHEIALRHRPEDFDVLAELGHAYTRLGRHQDGLSVDRRLVVLLPDNPTVHYNLACSLALLERPEEALDALEASVRLGYDDLAHLLDDKDLERLHGEQRFQALVAALKQADRRRG